MGDEPRSAVYVIRWEILIIVVSLLLMALVLTLPHDFSYKLLKEREALKQKELNVNATNIIQP